MSFDLTGLFGKQSQIGGFLGLSGNQAADAAGASGGQNGKMEGQILSVGTLVSGQVVKVSGDTVQIQLSPGQLLNARVEDGSVFQKGMTAAFEVSSMSDRQIALRVLFQNTANAQTITKALEAAQLPQTADVAMMVHAMMENGMAIDKESLQAMYRQVVAHPQSSGENIVAMNRLHIPLTDENIAQFTSYKNLEHQIRSSVETVIDSLQTNIRDLLADGKVQEAVTLMKQFLDIALPEEGDRWTAEEGNVLSDTAGQPNTEEPGEAAGRLQAAGQYEAGDLAEVLAESEDAQEKAGITNADDSPEQIVAQAGRKPETAGFGSANGAGDPDQIAVRAGEETVQMKDGAAPASMETEDVQNAGAQKTMPESGSQQWMSFLKDAVSKAATGAMDKDTMASLSRILSGGKFQTALKDALFKQWLMTPEQVADKESVEKYYARFSQQTGKLLQALENLPGAEKALTGEMTNIHNNIAFMNQLNQTVSYVQLPLRLAGENAHGDLYVYTNRKNLAAEDGNVSAFLHLDMDHLGPVDVYVAMQQQKVSTQFYLRDDEMIDFISAHMELLSERLQKKGYQMSATISLKDKPGSVMEEILEDQKENIQIGQHSFDMRA